jgi:Na+-translocating ferredoxin:NAD+ oxidoreductase RnfC subunit
MTAQEFVSTQLEWLQAQYEKAQDTETRERIITAIEDIVIAALGERTFPSAYKELPP